MLGIVLWKNGAFLEFFFEMLREIDILSAGNRRPWGVGSVINFDCECLLILVFCVIDKLENC